MNSFVVEIARTPVRVFHMFGSTKDYCLRYLSGQEPMFDVFVDREDLLREQALLDQEADEEGLKRRRFSDMFLERAVIQRKIAEGLVERDVILFHGSTVAVDGAAYLFTASCGTGKSTHTRLWREVFGQRAVMVNDDKPFLHVTVDGVTAFGAPWSGKHGLDTNIAVPLKGICILRRGAENLIRRASTDAVMEMLRCQCFQPDGKALSLLDTLMQVVPLWEMECTKDRQAAEVAWQAMSGT